MMKLARELRMTANTSLPDALRRARRARGLSQEAFSTVSSRTYLSSLERGLKSPTIKKLEDLCDVLAIHPLTLLMLTYASGDKKAISGLMAQVQKELQEINFGDELI